MELFLLRINSEQNDKSQQLNTSDLNIWVILEALGQWNIYLSLPLTPHFRYASQSPASAYKSASTAPHGMSLPVVQRSTPSKVIGTPSPAARTRLGKAGM